MSDHPENLKFQEKISDLSEQQIESLDEKLKPFMQISTTSAPNFNELENMLKDIKTKISDVHRANEKRRKTKVLKKKRAVRDNAKAARKKNRK